MPVQSWIILGLVQLSLVAICAVVFLTMKLKQRSRQVAQAQLKNEEATAALAQAGELLQASPAASTEVSWQDQIRQHLESLSDEGDSDQASQLLKLVLKHELEPNPKLATQAGEIIGVVASSEDANVNKDASPNALFASYQAIREESVQLTNQVLVQFPNAEMLLQMLHEAYQPIDELLELTIPPLDDPADFDNPLALEGDPALQVEIEALQDQLQTAKNEVATLEAAFDGDQSSSGDAEDEDLRALLQQFTKDSRDMLACIQKLEQENKALLDKLAESEADAA